MVLTEAQRGDIRQLLDRVAETPRRPLVIMLSCSKSKLDEPAQACELYRSITFKKALGLARSLGVPHYVLSAQYGLVSPQCVLPPYDKSIHDLSIAERAVWASNAASVLLKLAPPDCEVWFFTSQHYSEAISHYLSIKGVSKVHQPLAALPIGKMSGWLSSGQRALDRRELTANFYRELEGLADRQGLPTLRELIATASLPSQGIYYFFDPNEPTRFSTKLPRIVRVGTHAVSLGSGTSLRTRLRAHLGTKAGNGNHRGSIFRLHVGQAIIARDGREMEFQNWGVGQTATQAIRLQEEKMERHVSAYIGSLKVLFLEVADRSGPKSKRAYLERQALALLTEDELFVESPTVDWLGRWSKKPEIKASGLWNIQHIGARCDRKFLAQHAKLSNRDAELPL